MCACVLVFVLLVLFFLLRKDENSKNSVRISGKSIGDSGDSLLLTRLYIGTGKEAANHMIEECFNQWWNSGSEI